jgi:hypothetical protein
VSRAIKNEFGDVSDKFKFLHIKEQYGFEHGYASVNEEHPFGADEYINPNADIWDADVFLIDGIVRATCAMTVLLKHTKKDPVIFIHDYVGREDWYNWAVQFFDVEVVGHTLCRLRIKQS